jgi:hypothetical protein
MAAFLRGVMKISQDGYGRMYAIFAELDDPSLYAVLKPPAVFDAQKVLTGQTLAAEKAALARTMMPRIEEVMTQMREQNEQLLSGYSDHLKQIGRLGFDGTRAPTMSLITREVDLYTRIFDELAATLAFLSSHAGHYSPGANGMILFESDDIAREYNAHLDQLRADAADATQVDGDIRQLAAQHSYGALVQSIAEP